MNKQFKPFLKLDYWKGGVKSAAAALLAIQQKSGQAIDVVTLTAEMVLHAAKNHEVMAAIMSANFIVSDATATTWWLRANHVRAARIPGVDLAEELIRTSNHPRVAIFGGADDVVRAQASAVISKFGGTVVLSDAGPLIDSYTGFEETERLHALHDARPDIILVAFGHGKQEWWNSKLKKHLHFPTIIVGVGGTIDVWGGRIRRAPRLVRRVHLEWLWRLCLEPKRIRRIVDAVIVFPYRAFLEGLL